MPGRRRGPRRLAHVAALFAALVAGSHEAGAQQRPAPSPAPAPTRPDTVRATVDSVRGIPDSLPTPAVVRDSIKAPLVRAEVPPSPRAGPAYRWTRDSIFVAGAITLGDLLDRVPGLSTLRTSWLAGVQQASYLGDFRRVRVFRDGIELDAVDPRNGGILDLTDVQLWDLDEAAIEASTSEVRVHLRSWTVRNTTPYTRVDAYTGDEDTNQYRGFYGKRFGSGATLQVGATNVGTGARARFGGGGDVTSLFGRIGWTRRAWSADAQLTRTDRSRDPTLAFIARDEVLGTYEGRRDEAYVRIGVGDPDSGPWVQAMANALDVTLPGTAVRAELSRDTTATGVITADSLFLPDTSVYRSQYVLTGGLTRWGVRFSATDRYRVGLGRSWHASSVRAALDRGPLAVSAFAERNGVDSTSRVDVDARLAPLPWLAVHGGASRASDVGTAIENGRTNWRTELALRLGGGGAWLSGGRVQRGAGTILPPRVLARPLGAANPRPLIAVREEAVGGTVATLRGRLYRAVHADIGGVVWDAEGPYRARYQGRGELRVSTNLLSRFPAGNFGLQLAVFDEYRARVPFPVGDASGALAVLETPPANVLGAQIEIRILSASVTYQVRNALNREYQFVPGVTMPRLVNYYGVRWEFSN